MTKPNKSKAAMARYASGSNAGYGVLFGFGLLWTLFICFADWFVLGNVLKQSKSHFYVPVQAHVIKSSVESRSTDDGKTYYPQIDYSYRYNNIGYTGTVVRYSAMSNSMGSREAKDYVKARPEGAEITAWVDSSSPSNAVLERGLRGSDLFVLLFLTPFNMVSLGFIWAFWEMWRTRNDPIAGIVIEESPQGFCAGVGRKGLFLCFIATLGFVAFLSIFVTLIIGGKGFSPSMELMTGTWVVVLGLTVMSVFYTAYSNQSGMYDLEADFMHGTLTVPASMQNPSRRSYSLQDPSAVVLREVEKSDSEGSTTSYHVEFLLHDSDQRVLISDMQVADAAHGFAEWLADKLSIPLKKKKEHEKS